MPPHRKIEYLLKICYQMPKFKFSLVEYSSYINPKSTPARGESSRTRTWASSPASIDSLCWWCSGCHAHHGPHCRAPIRSHQPSPFGFPAPPRCVAQAEGRANSRDDARAATHHHRPGLYPRIPDHEWPPTATPPSAAVLCATDTSQMYPLF
jgi:hypothetical protein